ncbi:MAG: carboxylating nicotinate-nucleotide diphosphorylase [Verrucomicrobiota bacterium]|jgi:nicotinate-nucleotide pyrophosphorylase (carboxylating)
MPPLPAHDPIALALAEDLGTGDVTSLHFVEKRPAKARLFSKEPAVAAGVETAAEVFSRVDPHSQTRILRPSGSRLLPGDTVLEVHGLLPSLLTAERVALNFLQHLSGIATLTRTFVDAIAGSNAQILDTRKTVPGLRLMEKAAVVAGGGTNHRMGLYDMVMIKDNHLAQGTTPAQLQEAIRAFRKNHPNVRIELEADTLPQVRDFLQLEGVDIILLDNMTLDQMREAVRLAAGKVLLEASGGVRLDTVAAIAATGVDRISIGALTHSARAVDFSMELI